MMGPIAPVPDHLSDPMRWTVRLGQPVTMEAPYRLSELTTSPCGSTARRGPAQLPAGMPVQATEDPEGVSMALTVPLAMTLLGSADSEKPAAAVAVADGVGAG